MELWTYLEPAQAPPIMCRLIRNNTKTLKIDEKVIPMRLIRRDIQDKKVKHSDESKAFVELRERIQDP